MICMGVSKKDVMNLRKGDPRRLQARENTIATTAIHQKNLPPIAESETCIVTACHRCVARPQHNQFRHADSITPCTHFLQAPSTAPIPPACHADSSCN